MRGGGRDTCRRLYQELVPAVCRATNPQASAGARCFRNCAPRARASLSRSEAGRRATLGGGTLPFFRGARRRFVPACPFLVVVTELLVLCGTFYAACAAGAGGHPTAHRPAASPSPPALAYVTRGIVPQPRTRRPASFTPCAAGRRRRAPRTYVLAGYGAA